MNPKPPTRLTIIPFSTVSSSNDHIHDDRHTPLFNTHNHTLAELSTALPVSHIGDGPYAFSTWLPLVAHTQHIPPHRTHILLAAHSRWLRTGALPDSVADDVMDEWPGLQALFAGAGGEEGFFVRLDACSAKDSDLHAGRVRCARDAVRAVAGSLRAGAAVARAEGRGVGLCAVPWREGMDAGREFRVFVPPALPRRAQEMGHGGGRRRGLRIAAVSQYAWHKALRLPWEGAERLLEEIVAFAAVAAWEEVEGRKETLLEVLEEKGFVFDVAAMRGTGDGKQSYEVQLVELNPFGATTGCGSALFHWIRDAKTLYGLEKEDVEIRVALDQ